MSCDASGSGRLRHGAARDSLLGFRGVNGLGESFRGGGKVVKNVTGFDLPKLVCGAYGTLCVLTELTFRVYPRAAIRRRAVRCADVDAGDRLRRSAQDRAQRAGAGGPGLSARQHAAGRRPGRGADPAGRRAASRWKKRSRWRMACWAMPCTRIGRDDPFAAIGSGEKFADLARRCLAGDDRAVRCAARRAEELNAPHWLGDWAGGLIWLAAPPPAAPRIRAVAAAASGQAMLLRASAESRADASACYAPQPHRAGRR